MLSAEFNYCSCYSCIVDGTDETGKTMQRKLRPNTVMVTINMITTCRHHISNGCIKIILVSSLLIAGCMARGPHHPGGGVDKAKHQKHINEHLNIEVKYVLLLLLVLTNFMKQKGIMMKLHFVLLKRHSHIHEDLKEHNIPANIVDELTEDEKNYLYFKVHDLDGNNKLDGLEIYYSVTHHSRMNEHHDKDNVNAQVDNNASLLPHKIPNIEMQHNHVDDESVGIDFNHIVGK